MQAPELPANEAQRIATLQRLNILDTGREERFDRFTRISAKIFDMPIALISLVDRYRQWFKSAEGIDAEETPREISFCGHAILGDEVFEIRNARRDPRFRDNPLVVRQPAIRFYAGAPLKAPNGQKLGTLCIIDRVPRRLSDEEKTMLTHLADMVVKEMTSYVDTHSGLANRNALTVKGAKCFSAPAEERKFELLLFEIGNVAPSQGVSDPDSSLAEQFGKILHEHFPAADLVVHMGSNDYCVFLTTEEGLDVVESSKRVCSEAAASLVCEGGEKVSVALVGDIRYERGKHSCVDDLLREADELFSQHVPCPLGDENERSGLMRLVAGWGRRLRGKGELH